MTAQEAATRHLNLPTIEGARVAIQGCGNVGGVAAQYFHRAGAKVVAISDVRGGLYNKKGLDIPKLLDRRDPYEYLTPREVEADQITNKELLELECEVLIPAAIENQITEENTTRLKCRLIVEGGNGPTTPEADSILFDRGIFMVPDILANSGGVTVSYFEWVQNLQELLWSEEEISERLTRILKKSFVEVLNISEKEKVDMRTAALILGIGKVAEAIKLRGIYP